MKVIHKNGFSETELADFRPVVYKNLLDSAQQVVLYMRKTGIECVEFSNKVRITLSMPPHYPFLSLSFVLATPPLSMSQRPDLYIFFPHRL
jgi:hypothetical protein